MLPRAAINDNGGQLVFDTPATETGNLPLLALYAIAFSAWCWRVLRLLAVYLDCLSLLWYIAASP